MRNNKNEKGSVLVLVLLMTAIIAGLGTAYVLTSSAQQKQVDSSIDDQGYYQAALSGFDMARAYLLSKYTENTIGWDTELAYSLANSGTYIANSTSLRNGVNTNYTTGYTTWFQWCRNIDYYGNTFFAKIENNNDGGGANNDTDGVLKLTVSGWGGGNDPNNRSQEIQLEAMISHRIEPYAPNSALVVGGSIEIFGNPTITGTVGSVQSNGAVTMTGSAYVNCDVTATGGISAGAGQIGGTTNPYSARTNIPAINPPDYAYLATHIFKTNGLVYDQSNNLLATPTGWSYSGGTWSKTSNAVNVGVYYFAGSNVDVGGSMGSSTNPVTLTMIATGYINVTGSPSLRPSPNGGGIALMAGGDLRMRGAGGNVYGTGLYAAHEQISLIGTPKISGSVLAEDAVDNCTLVSSVNNIDLFGSVVEVAGNTLLTYNGDLTTVVRDGSPYVKILGFKKGIKAKY